MQRTLNVASFSLFALRVYRFAFRLSRLVQTTQMCQTVCTRTPPHHPPSGGARGAGADLEVPPAARPAAAAKAGVGALAAAGKKLPRNLPSRDDR